MKNIGNVLSLFDGMSCGRLALQKANIIPNNYFSSEIKKYAINVADYNFPDDKKNRLGDITKIDGYSLPKIDLLIGGSPCQDFSQANHQRTGHEGVKSGLFFEYVRLLKETNPTYFLLENVKMKKEHEDFVTNIMGVKPIVINSSSVSPQLRHRLYWTNIPNISGIISKDISLNTCLDHGYSDREKARALLESDSRPLTTPIKMAHRYFNKGFTTLIFKNEEHYIELKKHFDTHFKGKSAKEIDDISKTVDLNIYNGVRYMNKNEREHCQTVPNNYTKILTENEAACVLGDGWTIDVISHILAHI
jgi:DNA (cytosine-5)-methyltransferase 3A